MTETGWEGVGRGGSDECGIPKHAEVFQGVFHALNIAKRWSQLRTDHWLWQEGHGYSGDYQEKLSNTWKWAKWAKEIIVYHFSTVLGVV